MSAPFGRRRVLLLERRALGRYVVLVAGDAAATAIPGQFYMLAAAERWGGGEAERPFLPRAMSVLRAADETVEFMLEDVGPGTRRLCELEPGQELLLAGPFGNGFTQPGPDTLLVGGGIGIAPLLFVQERWGGRALLGFRDALHARAAELFSEPRIATDDGSLGRRGFVTDLLEEELANAPRVVYACGPPAMLAAVRDRARRHGVASELAMEAPMACGFGACYGCVVETVDGYRRACVDGPVFDGALLA
jgi:NAD(P)H-flavin reductase